MRTIPKNKKKPAKLVDVGLSVKLIEDKTADKVGEVRKTVYRLVCDDDPKKSVKLILTRRDAFEGMYPGQDIRVLITSEQTTLPVEDEKYEEER